jgi:hypothetical protein
MAISRFVRRQHPIVECTLLRSSSGVIRRKMGNLRKSAKSRQLPVKTVCDFSSSTTC